MRPCRGHDGSVHADAREHLAVSEDVVRERHQVRGVVQGVGFRPFVHELASRAGLAGFVRNDPRGVVVEVEGPAEAVRAFACALTAEAPPLAAVEAVTTERIKPRGETGFRILPSRHDGARGTPIPPDVGTCEECLTEVLDPTSRRHRYAFTNCTNCGPRYTITIAVPYDRSNTTMAEFPMCAACRAEYEDPTDRRFHAQPIACPSCGPRLALLDGAGRPLPGDPIDRAAALLRAGAIVAVKGLGGYHLACDASCEDVVARLRRRKRREEKPFALMVASIADARRLAEPCPAELAVLASPRRPIVLLRRRATAPVAPSVAPGNRYLGLMLPYTPLHHLLLDAAGRPLVLTSGNRSDEPIAHDDDDARDRLTSIVDAFLTHDRRIHVRCDDSVVRVVDGQPYPIRRSRGFAPQPLLVDPPFPQPVLGAGGELKHTLCLGIDDRAVLSHHIGDLETWAAMAAFTQAVAHLNRVFGVRPEVIAHDLHPEYLSTKWAQDQEGVELVEVQHHHAHLASCLVDNGRRDRVIGLILDGTGFGTDGTIWGCEVLAGDLADFERLAHLTPLPLPGGTAAVREPWRMAAVYLDAAFGPDPPELEVMRRAGERWEQILQLAHRGVNAPLTSSAGRLFDAAAALCGSRDQVSYEGQAAAELEQLADPGTGSAYPFPLTADGQLDGVALIAALAEDLARGRPPPEAAAAFHLGVAAGLTTACAAAREREGLLTVVLSGGTWQNLMLLDATRQRLVDAGFEVLVHRRVPPNDGGIALGQAAVAAAHRRDDAS